MLQSSHITAWNDLRFGLVLSGGGAKGAYQAGVLAALWDLDLQDKIQAVSGCSVGSLNMLLFAMNQRDLAPRLWQQLSYRNILVRSPSFDKSHFKELLRSLNTESLEATQKDSLLLRMSAKEGSPLSMSGISSLLKAYIDFLKVSRHQAALYSCAYDIQGGTPVYFRLNGQSPSSISQIVLASAAIPYLFDPVIIHGRPFADGGINNRAYVNKNSDPTPVAPLKKEDLDVLLVVRLNYNVIPDYSGLSPHTQIWEIAPSESLEPVKGVGTLNFSRSRMKDDIRLGYRDTLALLAPKIMRYLSEGKRTSYFLQSSKESKPRKGSAVFRPTPPI